MPDDDAKAVVAPRPARGSTNPTDPRDLLSLSLREFREYAAEWKALASAADNDGQRYLYLKMTSIWWHAALQFETATATATATVSGE
jgi:hypothetical protein